jgi:hypothetical protein
MGLTGKSPLNPRRLPERCPRSNTSFASLILAARYVEPLSANVCLMRRFFGEAGGIRFALFASRHQFRAPASCALQDQAFRSWLATGRNEWIGIDARSAVLVEACFQTSESCRAAVERYSQSRSLSFDFQNIGSSQPFVESSVC